VFWYCCLATGARPQNLVDTTVILTDSLFKWYPTGLKTETDVPAIPREYELRWSCRPTAKIRQYLIEKRRVPNLENPATNTNSFLKRTGQAYSTKAARIRLDNVLRRRVFRNQMTKTLFEFLTGHKWSTSTKTYAREC
jgi:hypothetical protein